MNKTKRIHSSCSSEASSLQPAASSQQQAQRKPCWESRTPPSTDLILLRWLVQLDDTISQPELQRVIEGLDADADTDGIIVQLPLPAHLDARLPGAWVSLAKDVDGFSPANVGATALHGYEPCASWS